DGIRDGHVTGVQTCALPILVMRFSRWAKSSSLAATTLAPSAREARSVSAVNPPAAAGDAWTASAVGVAGSAWVLMPLLVAARSRSEERRVGKECRARWCGE